MASSTEQSSSKNGCQIPPENQNMPSLDRLSELPDSILCHILSFLSTKHSMATSILARRWRFLWTSVPNLYMYDYDHHSSQGEPSFSDVINRIFILYNVKVMNTFTLVCKRFSISEYQIGTWITAAVSRKVGEVDLNLFSHVRLPQCLFTCRTLVVLTLRRCILPILPSDMCLPSLKTLILNFVAYKSDENFSHLISGCPMLEELEIDGIFRNDVRCCSISSPTIKKLKIFFSFDRQGFASFDSDPVGSGYRLVINAPALRFLVIKDYLSQYISAEALTSLVGADIILKPKHRIPGPEHRVYYSDTLLEFIQGLCNVKFLDLLIDYAEIVDLAFMASPIRFENLTTLELSADWRFISKFLESADNLEVLVIGEVAEVLKRWKEPEQVPTCLLSHLTTIWIDKFGLAKNEFEMVRYLLNNAQVLKTMTIYSSAAISDYKKKFSVLQKFSECERSSAACKLYFK